MSGRFSDGVRITRPRPSARAAGSSRTRRASRRRRPAASSTGRGQRTWRTLNARTRSRIRATKASCPISTPTLNISSASGMSRLRQADRGEAAREAEAVQQPERERDDPGMADREARLAAPRADDLRPEEQDRQRDRGVERRRRHAARSRAWRSASVMLCATVNAVIVFTSIQRRAHDQQQAEHEQQVIDAEQDVLDALREEDARGGQRAARGRDLEPRLRRTDELGRVRAVEPLDRGRARR